MRLHTHETRWFFTGPPPDPVVEWFRDCTPWPRAEGVTRPEWPAEWREDRYLALVGRDDIGIKSRTEPDGEGHVGTLVEFKGRTVELGVVELARGAVGVADQWIKWSYGEDEVPGALVGVFDSGPAPAVHVVRKKRLLRAVALTPGKHPVEIPEARLPPTRGLDVELTRVRLGASEHWTLGLEASPVDPDISRNFVATARPFLEAYPGEPALTEAASLSYPAWLLRRSDPGGAGPDGRHEAAPRA